MINRTNMRADKTRVLKIKNMKRPDGTPIFGKGETRLLKELKRYTMSCPDCGCDGVYDDRGDVICSDEFCAVVISDTDEGSVYPEDGFSGHSSNGINRGASGHPLMRVPALNPAGPKIDAGL